MENTFRAEPVEEAQEISSIAYGFMASKALFAALEFDLFTHIAQGAESMGALVQATGIAENRLQTLLTALKSLGLVTEAMDLAKWWNTRGQLGRLGSAAVRRGSPRTHYFAQARSVFAVAAHRCREVFHPPHSVTLWQLPEEVEEEFELHWERWLDHAEEWKVFFQDLGDIKETDLRTVFSSLNLVTDEEFELFSRLRRSAEGRAVPLPSPFTSANREVALLALGFARGEVERFVDDADVNE